MSSYRERITRIFSKYCPDQMSALDPMLTKYAGKEEQLIQALVRQYGPEPPSSARDNNAAETPAHTVEYKDTDGDVVKFVLSGSTLKKYVNGSFRKDVTALRFNEHAGEIRDQDGWGGRAAGGSSSVADVMKRLAELATIAEVQISGWYSASATAGAAAPSATGRSYRERITAIYTRYCPEKLDALDKVLVKYAGKEEHAIELLVSKYGPEPTRDNNAAENPAHTVEYKDTDGDVVKFVLSGSTLKKYVNGSFRKDVTALRFNEHAGEIRDQDGWGGRAAGGSSSVADVMKRLAELATIAEVQISGWYSASATAGAAAPSATGRSYRERITAIYTRYCPEKLDALDKVLVKYAGKEEHAIELLVSTYGPEPTTTTTTNQSQQQHAPFIERATYGPVDVTEQARSRVRNGEFACCDGNFNSLFGDPLPNVVKEFVVYLSNGQVLRFRENTSAVFAVTKRQPEYVSARERLISFYKIHQPAKLDSIDTILKQYDGNYDKLFETLEKKYGVVAQAANSNSSTSDVEWRSRLIRFYEKYDPPRAREAHDGLVDYVQRWYDGDMEKFMAELVQKYGGPEPGPAGRGSSSSSSAAAAAAPATTRERLVDFYRVWAAEKASNAQLINEALEHFRGRESYMFSVLEKKYKVKERRRAAMASKITREVIVLPNVASHQSVDQVQNWFSKELKNVVSATLKCQLRDQGWGNRKGMIYARRGGNWAPMLKEPAPHKDAAIEVAQALGARAQDMKFEFGFSVGGGGGHQLHINGAFLIVERDNNAVFSTPSVQQQQQPNISSNNNKMSYRDRLVAFYMLYEPGKLSIVDAALTKYSGREEELFQKLVKMFGPEPVVGPSAVPQLAQMAASWDQISPTGAARGAAESSKQAIESLVYSLESNFDLSVLEQLQTTLEEFARKNNNSSSEAEKLSQWACVKVGPFSTQLQVASLRHGGLSNAPTDEEAQLVKFFQHHHPPCVAGVGYFARCNMIEEVEPGMMWSTLIRRWGAPPEGCGVPLAYQQEQNQKKVGKRTPPRRSSRLASAL